MLIIVAVLFYNIITAATNSYKTTIVYSLKILISANVGRLLCTYLKFYCYNIKISFVNTQRLLKNYKIYQNDSR